VEDSKMDVVEIKRGRKADKLIFLAKIPDFSLVLPPIKRKD
jgi:hypothetical protein